MTSPTAVTQQKQEGKVDKQEKEETPLQSVFLPLMFCRLDFLYILLSHWDLFFCIFAFDYSDVADIFTVQACNCIANEFISDIFVFLIKCTNPDPHTSYNLCDSVQLIKSLIKPFIPLTYHC